MRIVYFWGSAFWYGVLIFFVFLSFVLLHLFKSSVLFCCRSIYSDFLFPVALRPNAGQGLLNHEVSRSHTATHHSRQDSSGRVISPSQRPLPDKTQHPQQTNLHALGGIRTHNLSRRATVDLRLRPRGQ